MSEKVHQIVIIGAATAGAGVKNELLKLFKKTKTKVFITIIERQKDYFWFHGIGRALVDSNFAESMFVEDLSKMVPADLGKVLNGSVDKIHDKNVVLHDGTPVPFDYLVIASGSSYDGPVPFKFTPSTKQDGLRILKSFSDKFEKAEKVVLVGGGAVAVEFSAEIKNKFPKVSVTLLHSGSKLLSSTVPDKFSNSLVQKLESLGVKIKLNSRVKLGTIPKEMGPLHTIETESGDKYESNITISCIGKQTPNTAFANPEWLDEKKLVKVSSFLNVATRPEVYSLGDAAETGAPRRYIPIAGQASVVAANIKASIEGNPLKEYKYKPFDIYFLALGPKEGMGFIPGLFSFITNWMAKSFKAANLFADKGFKDEYNQTFVPKK